MTHPDPEKRPTAFQILKHNPFSSSNKTKEQLERELQAEKTKTQILEKRLKEVSQIIKTKVLSKYLTQLCTIICCVFIGKYLKPFFLVFSR